MKENNFNLNEAYEIIENFPPVFRKVKEDGKLTQSL